jgi:tetratricopeptide (TPR) repeat protein
MSPEITTPHAAPPPDVSAELPELDLHYWWARYDKLRERVVALGPLVEPHPMSAAFGHYLVETALLFTGLGRAEDAGPSAQGATQLFTALGDERGRARGVIALCLAGLVAGASQDVTTLLGNERERSAKGLVPWPLDAAFLAYIGGMEAAARHDPAAATKSYEGARELVLSAGVLDHPLLIWLDANLGIAAIERGDAATGERYFASIERVMNDPAWRGHPLIMRHHLGTARTLAHRGDVDGARRQRKLAYKTYSESRLADGGGLDAVARSAALDLLAAGPIVVRAGNLASARGLLEDALEIALAVKHERLHILARLELARVLLALGDTAVAREHLQAALPMAVQALGDQDSVVREIQALLAR